jgi:hypothetical protein
MKIRKMSKKWHEKDKNRAAYLGGFSLGAAKRLRQCLEQAKKKAGLYG